MRKILSASFFLIASAFSFAKTAVVLDFTTEMSGYESNAVIMADMLRSELVNTGKLDVIDRKSMETAIGEMHLQMSEYMSPENAKQLGRMLNADYLVTGNVSSLSGNSILGKFNPFSKEKINVVVQISDVETLQVLSSAQVELETWNDFSKHSKKMARNLVSGMSKFSSDSQIKTNIENASGELFNGIWSAELVHDGIIDSYLLTFSSNHRVEVSVVSVSGGGSETSASGKGRWTFNDGNKILTLTVSSLKGNINHLKSISWKSLVNPSGDNMTFNCVIPVGSANGAKTMKCEFFKDE